MTDPYPYATPPAPPAPPQQPATIAQAVRLMYVAMGISVALSLIALLDVEQAIADARAGIDDASVSEDTIRAIFWTTFVLTLALTVGLWVWMAIKIGQGRAWARVLGTVFYGLSAAGFLLSLIGAGFVGTAAAGGPVGLAINAAIFALQTYIVVLIWRKESTAYIDAVSAYRLRSRGLY